jgi:hypothetical protein
LNGDGVPTARGGKWWPPTVRYVLDNPKYRGQVEYLFSYGGKEIHVVQPGRHTPIVGQRIRARSTRANCGIPS